MAAAPPRDVDDLDADAFLSDTADLVAIESPTADLAGCAAALARFVARAAERTGRRAELVTVGGCRHALIRPEGPTKVLLLGHVDTVWPLGTLARWPFTVDGDHVTGPGVFDMKAGLAMGLHATAAIGCPDGVGMLVTTDEETGSSTSQALIEEVARACDVVLVLEPSAPGGAVKHVRKGVSLYRADITGRAAHAGLEPEKGVNALMELAAQVPAVAALADPAVGTTVTPTVATAGTTMNTVPASAMFRIDVRAARTDELDRLRGALAGLRPTLPGAAVAVEHLGTRPPLERARSAALLARHDVVRERLGIVLPPPATSGGGSDGNFTAGVGTDTLDGLGAVGDGAHAEGEHITLQATLDGTRLLAGLLADLLGAGSS